MNNLEIGEKIHDFDIRREKILVKIQAQKLKRARLELHYAQFMADLARARDLEEAQFEANLDALDRAQADKDAFDLGLEREVNNMKASVRNGTYAPHTTTEETK